MDIKIIVAAHKKYQMPTDAMYVPIQVGAYGKEDIGYVRDDSGDQISCKNPYYCELTGLYWAWKNLATDYLGLVHYRRHFRGKHRGQDKFEQVLSRGQAEQILQEARVVVPKKRNYYIESLYSHYAHTHYAEHLDKTREILAEEFPEYADAYDTVVNRSYGFMFNMMIMEKSLADEYCQWLFCILEKLEDSIDMTDLSDFQKRLYGRVSEILLNVWLEQKLAEGRLKQEDIREVPYIHMEPVNWFKKGYSFLYAKVFRRKYSGSF